MLACSSTMHRVYLRAIVYLHPTIPAKTMSSRAEMKNRIYPPTRRDFDLRFATCRATAREFGLIAISWTRTNSHICLKELWPKSVDCDILQWKSEIYVCVRGQKPFYKWKEWLVAELATEYWKDKSKQPRWIGESTCALVFFSFLLSLSPFFNYKFLSIDSVTDKFLIINWISLATYTLKLINISCTCYYVIRLLTDNRCWNIL